ncbi:MAG: hypothetical protein AAGI52_18370 [Bacteroidota bacterium]
MRNPIKTHLHQVQISVVTGDAVDSSCDVLALKYAQSFHGADAIVAERMVDRGWSIADITCPPDGFRLLESRGSVAASRVLFVGVRQLREFSYLGIRKFGRKVLEALAGVAPEARHVSLTIHGPGYGLDETEAFEAEIAGLIDAITSNHIPTSLQRIDIVEMNSERAKRLRNILPILIPGGIVGSDLKQYLGKLTGNAPDHFRSVGYVSESRPHIFVAMPFREDMDDTYHYGITNAAKSVGMLCERADLSIFTGDILSWIKTRIDSASLLVADLTGANPNVYLEVGYAWGKGIPTVLLVGDSKDLKFDVQGQRCLVYSKIRDLEKCLTEELRGLIASKSI